MEDDTLMSYPIVIPTAVEEPLPTQVPCVASRSPTEQTYLSNQLNGVNFESIDSIPKAHTTAVHISIENAPRMRVKTYTPNTHSLGKIPP